MDKKAFFDYLRPRINLTTANVAGMDKALDYAMNRGTPLGSASYIFATGFWESAQTFQPVKEAYWLSETWRKNNLRYYPWYGRGLIQTTWKENYEKIAVAMGLPRATFTNNPDLLLMMEYALPAMFVGMEQGIYTGKDLDDYIDNIDESDEEDYREYKNARRIVNGTDKADAIAKLALTFEGALKAGRYSATPGATPAPMPSIPASPEPVGFWRRFFDWLFGG